MTAKYRQKVFDKRSARGGAKPFQIVLMAIATYFGQVLLAAFFYQNMEDMRFINAFYMVCRRLSPPFPPSPPFHPSCAEPCARSQSSPPRQCAGSLSYALQPARGSDSTAVV